MKKRFLILSCALLFILLSCSKETIKGSGSIVTENRTADAFTNIQINGSAKTFITYGPAFQLSVTGYANLVQQFETRVSNNILKAGYQEGSQIKNDNIELHITMPLLTGLKTSGSANTQIAGIFPYTPQMNFSVDGSGQTVMENGSTGLLTIKTSGSGTYDLLGLKANKANINISGSGEVKTFVDTRLDAKIDGSGKIYYQGNPALSLEINGSGKVVKY